MNSVGIVNELGANPGEATANHEENSLGTEFKAFNRRSIDEHTQNFGSQDIKTRTMEGFVKYIKDCLSVIKRNLTEEGEESLLAYIGEIIGNVEDHSGEPPAGCLWYVRGYLDLKSKPRECNLVIINFGLSYAETLSNLKASDYAAKEANAYVSKHINSGVPKDSLYTVIALQASISSKNSQKTPDRGFGTVDFIGAFQQISEECTEVQNSSTDKTDKSCRMALLSGNVHVLFDGSYKLEQDLHDAAIERIAFNKENSLELPPDPKFVTKLKRTFFPGTIVSIRFPIEAAIEKDESGPQGEVLNEQEG